MIAIGSNAVGNVAPSRIEVWCTRTVTITFDDGELGTGFGLFRAAYLRAPRSSESTLIDEEKSRYSLDQWSMTEVGSMIEVCGFWDFFFFAVYFCF